MTIVTAKQKVNGQLTYGGCILVLQALCSGLVQFNNQPWGHKVTKMLYLFWTEQPQANCQTWCVLRLGTTGCVHLCVSLRLEIRFGFKSAQICGLLPLLHRGSLSLAPGAMQQWVFSTRGICSCFWSTWTAAVQFIWLSCACTVLEAAMLGHGAASLFSPQPHVYSTTSRHPSRFF